MTIIPPSDRINAIAAMREALVEKGLDRESAQTLAETFIDEAAKSIEQGRLPGINDDGPDFS